MAGGDDGLAREQRPDLLRANTLSQDHLCGKSAHLVTGAITQQDDHLFLGQVALELVSPGAGVMLREESEQRISVRGAKRGNRSDSVMKFHIFQTSTPSKPTQDIAHRRRSSWRGWT